MSTPQNINAPKSSVDTSLATGGIGEAVASKTQPNSLNVQTSWLRRFGSSTTAFLIAWIGISAGTLIFFFYSMFSPPGKDASAIVASTQAMFTPGEMTHGHYQIEMACSACHTPMMGVKQDACLSCHEEELEIANDTHPASKFADPTNAQRLKTLNAKQCITCHREHVPDRTHPMGLSLPEDYCYHCHQDTLEKRPSHRDFAFDSCSNAGCHNYHDNRALYENFLFKHLDEPDFLDTAVVALMPEAEIDPEKSLKSYQHDAPKSVQATDNIISDWSETAHAAAGVNCQACHMTEIDGGSGSAWSNTVGHQTCGKCHEGEVKGFLASRHGMRLAQELSPMKPGMARHPMKPHSLHAELNCSSCHSGHRFDTKFAAVDACVECHNDQHTLSYLESSHYTLWLDELAGELPAGSGVSCATCHMPRMEVDYELVVQHNQNETLRPNEKMIRTVCMNCHGTSFSIDSLADEKLIKNGFVGQPQEHIGSLDMVKQWFESKAKKRNKK